MGRESQQATEEDPQGTGLAQTREKARALGTMLGNGKIGATSSLKVFEYDTKNHFHLVVISVLVSDIPHALPACRGRGSFLVPPRTGWQTGQITPAMAQAAEVVLKVSGSEPLPITQVVLLQGRPGAREGAGSDRRIQKAFGLFRIYRSEGGGRLLGCGYEVHCQEVAQCNFSTLDDMLEAATGRKPTRVEYLSYDTAVGVEVIYVSKKEGARILNSNYLNFNQLRIRAGVTLLVAVVKRTRERAVFLLGPALSRKLGKLAVHQVRQPQGRFVQQGMGSVSYIGHGRPVPVESLEEQVLCLDKAMYEVDKSSQPFEDVVKWVDSSSLAPGETWFAELKSSTTGGVAQGSTSSAGAGAGGWGKPQGNTAGTSAREGGGQLTGGGGGLSTSRSGGASSSTRLPRTPTTDPRTAPSIFPPAHAPHDRRHAMQVDFLQEGGSGPTKRSRLLPPPSRRTDEQARGPLEALEGLVGMTITQSGKGGSGGLSYEATGPRPVSRQSGGGPSSLALEGVMRAACSTDHFLQGISEELSRPIESVARRWSYGLPTASIAGDGFVRGGVFVIYPSTPNWRDMFLSSTPPAGSDVELAGMSLIAEYMGYGQWDRVIERGMLMLVCVRCPEKYMTEDTVQYVERLLSSDYMQNGVREAFQMKTRQPFELEVPILGGASLYDDHLKKLVDLLIGQLEDMLGVEEEPEAAGVGEEDEDDVAVRPIIQHWGPTGNPLFCITDREEGGTGPLMLLVAQSKARGQQGSTQTVVFEQATFASNRGGSDKLHVKGTVLEDQVDSARVALTFCRAHRHWMAARFGLLVDPLVKHGRDYFLSIGHLDHWNSGSSATLVFVVHMAAYFTGTSCASNVYLTGAGSISGRALPVGGYREKTLAAWKHMREGGGDGAKGHLLLPSASVEDGVLVDTREVSAMVGQPDGETTGTWIKEQVGVPAALLNQMRVLPVSDLFEALELSLPSKDNTVSRPVSFLHVPGRITVDVFVRTPDHLPYAWVMDTVEVIIFPGNGEVIITGCTEGYRQSVELGLTTVEQCWDTGLECARTDGYEIEPRRLPTGPKDFDIHVHVIRAPGGPELTGQIAMGVSLAYIALLSGKPIPANAAVCMYCNPTGLLSGCPLDAQMLQAARRNGVDTILLASAAEGATEAFLAGSSEKVEVQYLGHASGIMQCLFALGGRTGLLPDLGLDAPEYLVPEPVAHAGAAAAKVAEHEESDEEDVCPGGGSPA